MAKNSVRDYSATNSSNTDIQSINISEGCSPAGINNAIREVMVDLKNVSTGAVALETPSADQLNVDNLRLDGNTISSTDTNGDITIDPDGTGDVVVASDNLLISNVGGVGVNSTDNIFINATNTGIKLLDDEASVIPCQSGGSNNDNALDLGFSTVRWKDLYLSGGAYIGGTGSANYLSDYEEGTCSLVLTDGTNNATMSGSSTYTKIGRKVTICSLIRITSLGSVSGSIRVSGLPFTVGSSDDKRGGGVFNYAANINISAGQVVTILPSNSSALAFLYMWDSATGTTNMQASEWSSDGQAFISFTYFID